MGISCEKEECEQRHHHHGPETSFPGVTLLDVVLVVLTASEEDEWW
jgi:hypothetical protein